MNSVYTNKITPKINSNSEDLSYALIYTFDLHSHCFSICLHDLKGTVMF